MIPRKNDDMKINWKDFILRYPIGFFLSMVAGALMLGAENQILALLVMGALMVIPGLSYFHRNGHPLKEAAITSVLFGFTFTRHTSWSWSYLLLLFLVSS